MDQPENNEGQEPGGKWNVARVALACLGVILSLSVIVLLYLAAAWMVDLLPHDELDTGNYVAGAGLTVLVASVVSVMGESLIEDMVKFVFFAGTAAIIFSSYGAVIQSFIIAVPVGAGLPFLMRSAIFRLK